MSFESECFAVFLSRGGVRLHVGYVLLCCHCFFHSYGQGVEKTRGMMRGAYSELWDVCLCCIDNS